jgi:hypothetical protein
VSRCIRETGSVDVGADNKPFIYLGRRTRSSPSHQKSLLTMTHLIEVYIVGLSVFSLYVLKTYFEARAVWKQFGLVASYSS